MPHEIQPHALAKDEGRAVWFLGTLAIVKATAESTRGAFGLIDMFSGLVRFRMASELRARRRRGCYSLLLPQASNDSFSK